MSKHSTRADAMATPAPNAAITGDDFIRLRAAVVYYWNELDADERAFHMERYRVRAIPRGEKVKNIQRRFIWDVYYTAARIGAYAYDFRQRMGQYDNAHIETALKRIMPTIDESRQYHTGVRT